MPYDAHFPPSCPPSNAMTPAHTVLRAVTVFPFVAGDFQTYYEINSVKYDDCIPRGLSVFLEINALKRALSRSKGLQKKTKGYAMITLDKDSGCIAQTGEPVNDHYTWWINVNCDRMSYITSTSCENC